MHPNRHILRHTSDIRNAKSDRNAAPVVDLRKHFSLAADRAEKTAAAAAPLIRIKVRGEIKKSEAFKLFPSREQILREIADIEENDQTIRAVTKIQSAALTYKPKQISQVSAAISRAEVVFAPDKNSEEKKANDGLTTRRPRKSSKSWLGFAAIIVLAAAFVPAANFLLKGLALKDQLAAQAFAGYESLRQAQGSILTADFFRAEINFAKAKNSFAQSFFEIEKLGKPAYFVFDHLPQMLSDRTPLSAVFLLKAGEHLSSAGEEMAKTAQLFAGQNILKLILSGTGQDGKTPTDLLAKAKDNLEAVRSDLALVKGNLDKSSFSGLSPDLQKNAGDLKSKLIPIGEVLNEGLKWAEAGLKLLGHSMPQKYLLLFQNPGEIRAAGGFIGTYGLMEIDRGYLKNMAVNGIFDIDGQLKVNVVPPRPIQRISTAWSLHDSNWFFDFPISARKAAWFFEKTGNPTPDQVIALTPKVVEKLLEITGPIEMAEYGRAVSAENFVEVAQFEVELDYDKTLNKPKQFLADLLPKLMERLSSLDLEQWREVLKVIAQSFDEKDILVFSFDEEVEKFFRERGWAGEIKPADKDFLAVISSNINGFKTDRMIDEKVSHVSEIQADGSVVDTLTITRKHEGGKTAYDWWNRVNTNYLRVYVPLGSELLEAKGQTRDFYAPPIDYDKAGFQRDGEVEKVEKTLKKDEKTGTEIFEESGKTVFGNWVYVSPGESLTVSYKYRLPFKLDLNKTQQSFLVLVQKQPGSGSEFQGSIVFPAGWNAAMKHPEDLKVGAGNLILERALDRDYLYGGVFKLD